MLSVLDREGSAAIHIATWEGNWAAVKLLLDNGEDIRRKCSKDGKTVFDIATSEDGKNRSDRKRLLTELQTYATAMFQKQELQQAHSSARHARSNSDGGGIGGEDGKQGLIRRWSYFFTDREE